MDIPEEIRKATEYGEKIRLAQAAENEAREAWIAFHESLRGTDLERPVYRAYHLALFDLEDIPSLTIL